MKQEIIRDIDSLIGYLGLVKREVNNGTPERVDALGILSFVSIGLDKVTNDIKNEFNLTEE